MNAIETESILVRQSESERNFDRREIWISVNLNETQRDSMDLSESERDYYQLLNLNETE